MQVQQGKGFGLCKLRVTPCDGLRLGLLRDGTEALVGVLAMATGAGGVDIDARSSEN